MGQNSEWKEIKKLGFGLMRLPQLSETEMDLKQVCEMVDHFMAAGGTYFDTAFVYGNGLSENAARHALVERYPRESFTIADKLPLRDVGMPKEEVVKTSLSRLGVEYFDYYLLHSIDASALPYIEEIDGWNFLKQLKEQGIARHIGFSFHDTADVLDEILSQHPEMEFVQLQINYIDWENPIVQSRLCYETARKYGLPVMIMEPVKGGNLAAMKPEIGDLMKQAAPDASYPSWAIRFAASLEGVHVVLSGMSNLAQMDDNLSYMKEFVPLNDAERAVLQKVVEQLHALPTVPCTSCRYCVDACPQNINIPRVIESLNKTVMFPGTPEAARSYGFATNGYGKASECIACGACSARCPQHIDIPDAIARAAKQFEG